MNDDSALSRAQVFRSPKEFKEGRESVKDEERSGGHVVFGLERGLEQDRWSKEPILNRLRTSRRS